MARKRKPYIKETPMENTTETFDSIHELPVELQEAIEDNTTTDTPVEQEELVEAAEPVTEAVEVTQPVETPVAVPATAPVSEYSDNLTQILALVKQTKNAAVINYVDELMQYAKKMAPSQTMNPDNGAMNQAGLYSTIVNIIDHSGADFRIAFSAMLCIFHDYRNAAFGGAYVLRFMESVSLNSAKRKAFVKIVNLLSMTANPKTRKDALKHLDLKREVIQPFGEESRMRIDSYFKG